jgi:hypothetical protein
MRRRKRKQTPGLIVLLLLYALLSLTAYGLMQRQLLFERGGDINVIGY